MRKQTLRYQPYPARNNHKFRTKTSQSISRTTPVIGHREANSFVNVTDGQMVVLGGLQRTQKSTSHQKLGLLFELPIISQLFGSHNNELQRTELLLFVRPHVMPIDQTTADTKTSVKILSNKDQVEDYLKDPTKQPDHNDKAKNLLDRF